jgi:hypothetical protein
MERLIKIKVFMLSHKEVSSKTKAEGMGAPKGQHLRRLMGIFRSFYVV